MKINCRFLLSLILVLIFSRVANAQTDKTIPLYEQDNYAIYPASAYWCSTSNTKVSDNIALDIVYDVAHDQRDALLFGGSAHSNYNRFFNKVISPIIAEHCPHYSGFSPTADLRFNNRDDWEKHNGRYWDRLKFSYFISKKSQGGRIVVSYKGQFSGRYLSAAAKAKQQQDNKLSAIQAAKNRDIAKEQGHPFKVLAGGAYLDTIYSGDFVAQDEVAWYYLSKIKKGNENDAAMGVFLSTLGSTFSTTKKDMTVLEEIGMYYLARSSERPDDCFDPGAIERTFTYHYPEIVYEDGYRIPASQLQSAYKVNPAFIPLCDRLCEKQGVLYAVANGINLGMKTLEIADLFRGIDEMIKHYSCRSPEIKRFEANLLQYTQQELNQPANIRRNTFKTVLDAPPSDYIPYALQPRSAIADKFMADNAKNANVVTTLSGLQYIMLTQGQGRRPEPGDTVNIYYKGTLENGRVIAKKYAAGTPSTISTNGLIRGMSEAVLLLKPGGRIKIFVPPQLGFGNSANGVINKDSVLIYEIELVGSVNSPSHISQPATIVSTEKPQSPIIDSAEMPVLTAPVKQQPKKSQLEIVKPAPDIIQPVNITPVINKPKLLASEDSELKNYYQFPEKLILDNTLIDFLVVKLMSGQLDDNSWTAMLASRWSYEKSVSSPTGGLFFHPEAQYFSNDDVESTMPPFQEWMRAQANKLPEIVSLPASVLVAKIGPSIHAVPADGCAVMDEKTNLIHHQTKLMNAISQSVAPAIQICQQQVTANTNDLLSCVMANQSDPNFCKQQVKDKLEKCLAESANNSTDTWEKIKVQWIQSNFSTSQCGGHAAYERLRSLKQFPVGVGSIQLKPSRITARFTFDYSFDLPPVKDSIFALERTAERGILMFKIKALSGELSSIVTKQGLGIQINATIIGTEYMKMQ
jgi:FKBP-type peptidyl-prolyl cis-trans isomerase